jgi:ATP-dependent Clp protease ATP-binding subunit ClpA
MEDLFETLKTGNLSLDERKDIIEELNSQYGPYLKGLITEKMTTEDLADAEKYANDQMLKKIEIEVRQEAIKKVMEAYKKEESRHLEAEKEVRKSERLAKEGEKAAEKSDDDQAREYYTKSAYEALKWSKMKLSESEKKMADSKKALDDEINDLGGNSINKDLKKRSLADIKKEIDTLLGKDKTDKIGKGGADAQSGINTSALGGASGGLGEAKVIKIDFHKALMEVNVPGGNGTDIIGKGQLTVEAMLRIINNLSMAQGATM